LLISGLLALLFREVQAPPLELPWWSAPLLFVLPPAIQAAGRACSRRQFQGRAWWLATRVVAAALLLSPLLVELGFLFLTDFATVAKTWIPWALVPGWLGLEALVLLLPMAVAHAQISSRPGEALFPGLFAADNLRARLALFGWSVLCLYLALSTVVGRSAVLRIWIEESTPAALGFSLLTLLLLLFVVPRLLLAILDTQPIRGHLGRVAEAVAAQLGVRPPELLEWRTGDEFSNAMVLARPFAARPVLFTDAFLAQLSFEEFRAVLAHELGHVAGRHVGLFVRFVLGAALTVDVLLADPLTGPWGLGFALLFLLALAAAVGYLSRRLELEADLFAFEVNGEIEGLARALGRAGGRQAGRKSWRHFSVTRRLIFLRACQLDPGVGLRLRASLGRARKLAGLLLVAGLLLTGWSALQSAPAEHFWIDLRRGDLVAAEARLVHLDSADFVRSGAADYAEPNLREHLDRLVRIGAALAGESGPLTTVGLGPEAAAAMEAGLQRRARDIFDLALLIGGPEAPDLARAARGELDPADISGPWRAVLAARPTP